MDSEQLVAAIDRLGKRIVQAAEIIAGSLRSEDGSTLATNLDCLQQRVRDVAEAIRIR